MVENNISLHEQSATYHGDYEKNMKTSDGHLSE